MREGVLDSFAKGLVRSCIRKYIGHSGVKIVVTREDIVAEIQRVPDERLDEVYTLLKKYQKNGGEARGC